MEKAGERKAVLQVLYWHRTFCVSIPLVAKPSFLKIPFQQGFWVAWVHWAACPEPQAEQGLQGTLVLCCWWPVPALLLLFCCWSPADGSGSIPEEGSESNGLMVLWLTCWCLMCCRYARAVLPVSLSSTCSCADSFPVPSWAGLAAPGVSQEKYLPLLPGSSLSHTLCVRKGPMNAVSHFKREEVHLFSKKRRIHIKILVAKL